MSLWKKFTDSFSTKQQQSDTKPVASTEGHGINSCDQEKDKASSHRPNVVTDGNKNCNELFETARKYDQGTNGYPQDHNKALDYYKKAEELGSAEACFFIGVLYRYGLGCRKNLDSAIKYFEKAIANHISEAYVYLAYMYNDELMQRMSAAKYWERYFETELYRNNGETKLESDIYMYTKFATVLAYSELVVDYDLPFNKKDVVFDNKNTLLEYWTESYLTSWNEGEIESCNKYKKYIHFIGGKVPKEHSLDVDETVIEHYNNGIMFMNNYGHEEALQCFNYVIDVVGSNYLDTYESMALCYINLKKYDDAITSLSLALNDSTDSDCKARLFAHFAFCYQMLGFREEAYNSLIKSIKFNKSAIYSLYEFVIDNLGWTNAIESKSSVCLNVKTTTGNSRNSNIKGSLETKMRDNLSNSENSDDDFLDNLKLPNPENSWDESFEMAESYYYGLGDEIQDFKEALKYYKKAADLGSDEAMLKIGVMNRCGEGCNKNTEKALDYFKQGAKSGNVNCYAEMAKLFMDIDHTENASKCWDRFFLSDNNDDRRDIASYAFNYLLAIHFGGVEYKHKNSLLHYKAEISSSLERLKARYSKDGDQQGVDMVNQYYTYLG